jgi:hypothetical protein
MPFSNCGSSGSFFEGEETATGLVVGVVAVVAAFGDDFDDDDDGGVVPLEGVAGLFASPFLLVLMQLPYL